MSRIIISIPIRGIHRGLSVDKTEAAFTDQMNNVWPFDAAENRVRLAKRPGFGKWSQTQVGGVEMPVTCLAVVNVNG